MNKTTDYCTSNKPTYPKFLNVSEISRILNISPATVRKMIRNKQLEAFKIGNRYRVPEQYLKSLVQVDMKGTEI